MVLFIAKRRKEFNEGPLLIRLLDGGRQHCPLGSTRNQVKKEVLAPI